MTWRGTGRVCGAALTVATLSLVARPASAQYERMLAGVRLNSTTSSVLAKYGNPNDIIIGEVGVRAAGPPTGGVAGGAGGGFPGGGYPGAGGGFGPGAPGGGYPGAGGGYPGAGGGFPGGGYPGAGGGFGPGAPGGGYPGAGGGYPGAGGGFPGAGGGFPGAGRGFGGRGGAGGGVGQFGQTVSTLAPQQEVTWIYDRKVDNNLVSYEFLIGPDGHVIQIRASGYKGGNVRTQRGVVLGSTYKDVVRKYGYPEEHYQVGRVLVASYRNKGHVQFQFMNERGVANPTAAGNKVVAITIATVE